MEENLRHYLTITAGYWAFTVTDGAIRMLVVLYFHLLGYSPFEVAMLFLFYEFFGIVTNLVGGWLGARVGLNITMHSGMALQVIALAMLMVPDASLSVVYVMVAQAISGIAKDLNKMSAKASVKTLLPTTAQDSTLFKWIAVLTGSKNALKGVGFFLGAVLLQYFEFQGALAVLAGGLFIVLLITIFLLPANLGKAKNKPKFQHIFSNTAEINWLSAARLFLFAARDIWFVVALPVYLYAELNWPYIKVGGFLALWVIGYGIIQACAPRLLQRGDSHYHPSGMTAKNLAFLLFIVPAAMVAALMLNISASLTLIVGLIVFGIVFALNSSVHSYLIVAWSEHDTVSMNVGFYYMANAAGRLVGTVLSGLIYQAQGLIGCLIGSAIFILITALLSIKFSHHNDRCPSFPHQQ